MTDTFEQIKKSFVSLQNITTKKPHVMSDITKLFSEDVSWGLRGDKYLWREMLEFINEIGLPETTDNFEKLLHFMFKEFTGFPIDAIDEIKIDRYENSGMSGSYVCCNHWKEYLIPCLIDRYKVWN